MKLTNKEAREWLMAIKRDYIYGGDEDYDKRRKIALDMGAEALENQKTGHWIWEEKIVSETYTDPKEIDYIGWVCDNCHNPPNDYAEWDNPEEKPMYKFCPNCGAKMEK